MSHLSEDLTNWLYLTEDNQSQVDADPSMTETESSNDTPHALYMVQFQLCTLGFSFALSITWIGCSEMCVMNKQAQNLPDNGPWDLWRTILPSYALVSECVTSIVKMMLWYPGKRRKRVNPKLKGKEKLYSLKMKKRLSKLPKVVMHLKGQRLKGENMKGDSLNKLKLVKVVKSVDGIDRQHSADSTETLNDVPEMCKSEIATNLTKVVNTPIESPQKQDTFSDVKKETTQTCVKRFEISSSRHKEISIISTAAKDTVSEHTLVTNVHPSSKIYAETTWRTTKEQDTSKCWIYNQPPHHCSKDLGEVARKTSQNTQSITSILIENTKKVTCLDPGFVSYSPYTPPVRYINIGKSQALPIARNLLACTKELAEDAVDGPRENQLSREDHVSTRDNIPLRNGVISTSVDEATTDLICGDMQTIINKYSLVQNSQGKTSVDIMKKEIKSKQKDQVEFCNEVCFISKAANKGKENGVQRVPDDQECTQEDYTIVPNEQLTVSELQNEITYTKKVDFKDSQKRNTIHGMQKEQHFEQVQQITDIPKKNHVHFSDKDRVFENELVANEMNRDGTSRCSQNIDPFGSRNAHLLPDDVKKLNPDNCKNIKNKKSLNLDAQTLSKIHSQDPFTAKTALNQMEATLKGLQPTQFPSSTKGKSHLVPGLQRKEIKMFTRYGWNKQKENKTMNIIKGKDKISTPVMKDSKIQLITDTAQDTAKRCSLHLKRERKLESQDLHEISAKFQKNSQNQVEFPQELEEQPKKLLELPYELKKYEEKLQTVSDNTKHGHLKESFISSSQLPGEWTHQSASSSLSASAIRSIDDSRILKKVYGNIEQVSRRIMGPVRRKCFADKFCPYNIPLSRRGVLNPLGLPSSHQGIDNVDEKNVKQLLSLKKPETPYTELDNKLFTNGQISTCGHESFQYPIGMQNNEMVTESSSKISYKTCDAVAFLNIFLHMPKFIGKRENFENDQPQDQICDCSEKSGVKAVKSRSSTKDNTDQKQSTEQHVDPVHDAEKKEQSALSEVSSPSARNVQTKSNLGNFLTQYVKEKLNECATKAADLEIDSSLGDELFAHSTDDVKFPSKDGTDVKEKINNGPVLKDASRKEAQNSGSRFLGNTFLNARSNAHQRKIVMGNNEESKTLHSTLVSNQSKRNKPYFTRISSVETSDFNRPSKLSRQEFTGNEIKLPRSDLKTSVPSRIELKRSKIPVYKSLDSDEDLPGHSCENQLRNKPGNQFLTLNKHSDVSGKYGHRTGDRGRAEIQDGNYTFIRNSPANKLKRQDHVSTLPETGDVETFPLTATDGSSWSTKQSRDNNIRRLWSKMQGISHSKTSSKWNSGFDVQIPSLLPQVESKPTTGTTRQIVKSSRTEAVEGKLGMSEFTAVSRLIPNGASQLQLQSSKLSTTVASETKKEKNDRFDAISSQELHAGQVDSKNYSQLQQKLQPRQNIKPASFMRQRLLPEKTQINSNLANKGKSDNITAMVAKFSIENQQKQSIDSTYENPTKDTLGFTDLMHRPGYLKFSAPNNKTLVSPEKWKQRKPDLRSNILSNRSGTFLAEVNKSRENIHKGFQIIKKRLSQTVAEKQLASNKFIPYNDVSKINKITNMKIMEQVNVDSKREISKFLDKVNSYNFPKTIREIKTPERRIKTAESTLKTPEQLMETLDERMNTSEVGLKTPEEGIKTLEFLKGKKIASFTKRNMAQDVKSKLSCAAVKWFSNVCEGFAQPDIYAELRGDKAYPGKGFVEIPAKNQESLLKCDRTPVLVSRRYAAGVSFKVQDSKTGNSPFVHFSDNDKYPKRLSLKMPDVVSSSEHAPASSDTILSQDDRTTESQSIFQKDTFFPVDNLKTTKQNQEVLSNSIPTKYIFENSQSQLAAILNGKNPPIETSQESSMEVYGSKEICGRQTDAKYGDTQGRGLNKDGQTFTSKNMKEQRMHFIKSGKNALSTTDSLLSVKTTKGVICPKKSLRNDATQQELDGGQVSLTSLCLKENEIKSVISTSASSSLPRTGHQVSRASRASSRKDSEHKLLADRGDNTQVPDDKREQNATIQTEKITRDLYNSHLVIKPDNMFQTSRELALPYLQPGNKSEFLPQLNTQIQCKTRKEVLAHPLKCTENPNDKYNAPNNILFICNSQGENNRSSSIGSNGSSLPRASGKKSASPLTRYKACDFSLSLTDTSCPSKQPRSTCSNQLTTLASSTPIPEQLTSPTTLFTEVDCPEETSCRRTKLVRASAELISTSSGVKKAASRRDNVNTKRLSDTKDTNTERSSENKDIKHNAFVQFNPDSKIFENLSNEGNVYASMITKEIQTERTIDRPKDKSEEHMEGANSKKVSDKEQISKSNVCISYSKEDEKEAGETAIKKDNEKKECDDVAFSISGTGTADGLCESNLPLVKIRSDMVVTTSRKKFHYESFSSVKRSDANYEGTSEHMRMKRPYFSSLIPGNKVIDNNRKILFGSRNEASSISDGLSSGGTDALKQNIPSYLCEMKKQAPSEGSGNELLCKQQKTANKSNELIKQTLPMDKDTPSTMRFKSEYIQGQLERETINLKCQSDMEYLPDMRYLSKMKYMSRDARKTALLLDKKKLFRISESASRKPVRSHQNRFSAIFSQEVGNTGHKRRGCVSLIDKLPRQFWENRLQQCVEEPPSTSNKKAGDFAFTRKKVSSDKDSKDTSQISLDTANVFTELCLHSSLWNNTLNVVSETFDDQFSEKVSSPNDQISDKKDVFKQNIDVYKIVNTDKPLKNVMKDERLDFPQGLSDSARRKGDTTTKPDLRKEGISKSSEETSTNDKLDIPHTFEITKPRKRDSKKQERIKQEHSYHTVKRSRKLPVKLGKTHELFNKESVKDLDSEKGTQNNKKVIDKERIKGQIRSEDTASNICSSMGHSVVVDFQNTGQERSHKLDNPCECVPTHQDITNDRSSIPSLCLRPRTSNHQNNDQSKFENRKDQSSTHAIENETGTSREISFKLKCSFWRQKNMFDTTYRNPKLASGIQDRDLGRNNFKQTGSQLTTAADVPRTKMSAFNSQSEIDFNNEETPSTSQQMLSEKQNETRKRNNGRHNVSYTKYGDIYDEKDTKNTMNKKRDEIKVEETNKILPRERFWNCRNQKSHDLLTSMKSKVTPRDNEPRSLIPEITLNTVLSSALPLDEAHLARTPSSQNSSMSPQEGREDSPRLIDMQIDSPENDFHSIGAREQLVESRLTSARCFYPKVKFARNNATVVKGSLHQEEIFPYKTVCETTPKITHSRSPDPFCKSRDKTSPYMNFLSRKKLYAQQLAKDAADKLNQGKLDSCFRKAINYSSRSSPNSCPYLSVDELNVLRWQRRSPERSINSEKGLRCVRNKLPRHESFVGRIVEMFEKKFHDVPQKDLKRQTNDEQ